MFLCAPQNKQSHADSLPPIKRFPLRSQGCTEPNLTRLDALPGENKALRLLLHQA